MTHGPLPDVGTASSLIVPAVVIRPILLPRVSANQSAPSGPAVIPYGALPDVGTVYSVTAPVVVEVHGDWRTFPRLYGSTPGEITADEREKAERLVTEKFGTDEWLYRVP